MLLTTGLIDKKNTIVIDNILTIPMAEDNAVGVYSIEISDGIFTKITKNSIPEGSEDYHIDGKGLVAIPGLINAHIHADILLARGLGDGLSLHEQGGNSFIADKQWFYNELDDNARILSRKLQYIEAIKSGTTYLCDFLFWNDPVDSIIEPFNFTGLDGAVVFDFRENFLSPKQLRREKLFQIKDVISQGSIKAMLQAPSEELFEKDLLCDLKKKSQDMDIPIHLHLAETQKRSQIVEAKYNKSPVEFLDSIGFLDKSVIGSHGVYFSDRDCELFSRAQASIVNSPVSEMKIADGIAPIVKMKRHGIPVGIGTDGALWNDSADMFGEMKMLMLLQRVCNGASSFSAQDALYAATLGGAKALGIDESHGSIQLGKKANIVLIDFHKAHLVPYYNGSNSNVVENLVSCAKPSDVKTVICNGTILLDDFRLIKVAEDDLIEECQELGESLFKELT